MGIRLGILGLGNMGRHHARAVREVEGLDLVALVDPAGDEFRVADELPVYETTEELIAHGVDAAIVAVPTPLHEEVSVKLAEAGVHSLIEKPIAHTPGSGARLATAFSQHGATGAVGHVERFNPALIELHERLASNELGQVFQLQTRRQGPFPTKKVDVGVINDLGSHDIDLTRWLARSEYSQIAAEATYRSDRDKEDMATITGKLANGVIVNHLVNWLTPFKERVVIVTGERGAFVADTLAGDLTLYENGTYANDWTAVTAFRGVAEGTMTRFALNKVEPLKKELEAFRDLILGLPNHSVSLAEGLAVLEICEAALESAHSKETIQIARRFASFVDS